MSKPDSGDKSLGASDVDANNNRLIAELRQANRELEALLSERSEELQASHRRYRRIFQRSKDTIIVSTPTGELIDINRAGLELYGYESLEQMQNIVLAEQMWVNPKDREEYLNQLREFGYVSNFEAEHRTRTGTVISALGTSSIVRNDDGSIAEMLTILRDVSEQKRLQRELEYLARTDSLTGLANRLVFRERLDSAVSQWRRDGQLFALMMLDVDHLKQINDGYGHPTGDAVLKEVARRFQGSLREYDVLARFGGDEFALLLPNVASREIVAQTAERLVSSLNEPIYYDGNAIATSTSVGIALSEDGRELDQILQQADRALYRAKHRGRNQYSF